MERPGSWEAFYQAEQGDDSGNASHADIMTQDAADCYFNAQHRLLAAICVRGLAVVEKRDASGGPT